MTDRYKGFLITLDKEIRSDDAKELINALKMIRGVYSVKPYVKGIEDYMSEQRGINNAFDQIIKFCIAKGDYPKHD